MSGEPHQRPAIAAIRPKKMRVAQDDLVRMSTHDPATAVPLVIEPQTTDLSLAEWLDANPALVADKLLLHGAVLFSGFHIASPADFHAIASSWSSHLLAYQDRSTPRSTVLDGIYTSTEYPAEHEIPMHNENSYSHSWPGKVWFYCHEPSTAGGETPLADSALVFERIDPLIRQTFCEKKVMYVRNYRDGLDLDWRTAFQTDDKRVVEAYCQRTETQFEWLGAEHLRTCQVRHAVLPHPISGRALWFNQAHLFHVSSLPDPVRSALLQLHTVDDLPRNAYYGDGTIIEDEVLAHIRDCYRTTRVLFPWRRGQVLLIDNMRVAHGRMPFVGRRSILVAMSEPLHATQHPRDLTPLR